MATLTPKKAASLIKKHGGVKAASRNSEWGYNQLQRTYKKAVAEGIMEPINVGIKPRETLTGKTQAPTARRANAGTIKAKRIIKEKVPSRGEVRRYILTCAQNDTKVHPEFWDNLTLYADHLDAELMVARITYDKKGWDFHGGQSKSGNRTNQKKGEMTWDPKVEPYLCDNRVALAPGLVWVGDIDMNPTAANPLSGLTTFTGRATGIFPHPQIALESVSSLGEDPTKFNMTTGTVTLRNYILRKTGQIADHHHNYAALIVEVDSAGNWYPRHLVADSTGCFYDLNVQVKNGEVTGGHRVEHIYWADGHDVEADPEMVELAFGEGGIKDELRPKKESIGDIISFKSRSHHEMKNPHKMFLRKVQGLGDVQEELLSSARFIAKMVNQRDWCKTSLVYGNHEQHIARWLQEHNVARDPTNALFGSRLQASVFDHIQKHGEEPNIFQLALDVAGVKMPKHVRFLLEDENDIVCDDVQGGIENGMHGHRGLRGAKATIKSLGKLGRKVNIGDKHGCGIYRGVYCAGTFSWQGSDWTHGPSDWSCSHIITYPNGKRTLLICWNGKAWA
jgi:hypothetical protein